MTNAELRREVGRLAEWHTQHGSAQAAASFKTLLRELEANPVNDVEPVIYDTGDHEINCEFRRQRDEARAELNRHARVVTLRGVLESLPPGVAVTFEAVPDDDED